jgi:hypothetical protein
MGTDLKGKMLQDEREWRDAEFERWAILQELLGLLRVEALEPKHEAKEAHSNAREARAAVQEAAEMAMAKAAAALERVQQKLKESEERVQEKELLSYLVKCRIAELEREEWAETCTKLLAQAEKEWGPDHASRPPRAVYDMRGPM